MLGWSSQDHEQVSALYLERLNRVLVKQPEFVATLLEALESACGYTTNLTS